MRTTQTSEAVLVRVEYKNVTLVAAVGNVAITLDTGSESVSRRFDLVRGLIECLIEEQTAVITKSGSKHHDVTVVESMKW